MKMAMNEKVVKDLKAGIKQRRKQAKDDLGAYEDSLADNAKLSMPFSQLGLCPEFASSLLFQQIVVFRLKSDLMLFHKPLVLRK